MKKNIRILILALVGVISGVQAQQDPLFTNYMYNMSIVNPAYTTSDVGTINAGLLHRRQYSTVDGPVSTSLFGHVAVNDKIEVGISYFNDNTDDVYKANDINADFAYKLALANENVLSFGIKAGMRANSYNGGNLNLQDPNDPAFDTWSKTNANIGAGAYLNGEKYYVGLSSPNLVASELSNQDNLDNPEKRDMHAYLTGGYVFTLSETVKFKPATMIRYTKSTPVSIDITANFLLFERLELGAAYRISESVSGLINFRVLDNLRLGYAYDYTANSDSALTNTVTGGSHEFLLLYDLNILSKKYDKSPRFF